MSNTLFYLYPIIFYFISVGACATGSSQSYAFLEEIFQTQSNCGLPKSSQNSSYIIKKIINGVEADPSSFPWVVSMRIKTVNGLYIHICGGSLISDQHVITAAHCLKEYEGSDFAFVIGTQSLDEKPKSQYIYNVANIFSYPFFDKTTTLHDLAIITLTTRVTDQMPICLPRSSVYSVIFGRNVQVAGWGLTSKSNSHVSGKLMKTELKVINGNALCLSYSTNNYCVLDSSDRNSNICFGDSGGPLMFYANGNWYLYGISSFVLVDKNKECLSEKPSFYTMVPRYLGWINQLLNL